MHQNKILFFQKAELYGLYILFFSLPILKVPKNFGIAIFMFSAIIWRTMSPNVKLRKPDGIETILILMVIVSIISTVINWPIDKGINGLKDTINFVCIALFLHNNDYSEDQKHFVVKLFIAGTFIGLCWGLATWLSNNNHLFEFRRMMVAETSIITGIATSAILAFLLGKNKTADLKWFMPLSIIGAFFISCMFLMGNRSGVVGFFAFLIILIPFIKKQLINKVFIIFIGFTLLCPTIFILSNERAKNRINHLFTTGLTFKELSNNDKRRIDYWNLAIEKIKTGESLLFGVGPRNFKSIDPKSLPNYKQLIPKEIAGGPHAHNALLTKAAEEGLFGVCLLLVYLLYVTVILYQLRFKSHGKTDIYWTIGLAALIIPLIAGMFYAPFRREVAWVSMLFFGFVSNKLKKENV